MAKETNGGTWINVNSNDDKGHVNVYGSDPREPHDESIHINIDYNKGTFNINEKSGGDKSSTDCKCFLTTACMTYMQEKFDDSCYELNVLRWLRDNFVSSEDINHYYEIAPIIVESINISEKSDIVYNYIYDNVVDYCVKQIENENYELAYSRYKNSILSLEETFAIPLLQNKLVKTLKLSKN
ncbi:MAG: hypothetical protein Q4G04_02505 [bacterium]|nr:hypothetical protein [bacterium]